MFQSCVLAVCIRQQHLCARRAGVGRSACQCLCVRLGLARAYRPPSGPLQVSDPIDLAAHQLNPHP